MTGLNKIFVTFMCGVIASSSAVANNCDNEMYRRYNPDKCSVADVSDTGFSFGGTVAVASGAAALIGGTIALFGLSSGGDGESSDAGRATSSKRNTTTVYSHPTLSLYNSVGADIDSIRLAAATSSSEYVRNFDHYNEIRAGYSLARGFTGAGSTIAVLDSGKSTFHGGNVAYLAGGPIAPDANVVSYQVSDRNENFKSFAEIGNVINAANAAGTNIYNASWSSGVYYANHISTRDQLERMTHKNFVNALTNAVSTNDAIFVWAAGNDYNNESSFLSAMPLHVPELQGNFVNVVAWDNATNGLADFSNACGTTKEFCITAPGTNLTSPKTETILEGTSFAAPIVSAAIAVLRQAFPYMRSSEITGVLFATARDLGVAGVDEIYGHGMLDLERATRPVGVALVPLSDGQTVSLSTARVSGTIGHKIKSSDIQFSFIDSFGRAFETNLNDNISVRNRGIGFERLRQDSNKTVQIGNIEIGFKSTDMFMSQGFLETDSENIISFIGFRDGLHIGNTELFYHATLGTSNPRAATESMISGFSNIYTASAKIGARYGDFSISIGTPDTIIGGNMHLNIPTGRSVNGDYTFAQKTIGLASRPSVEFSAQYKFMTAGFVDNPYGTDEIYMLAKTRISF
ncbi:MAG: S8 family serine peptidase [Alphaproteobacteria bacterium]|nr:S8 family serine peptidase [Alphaproteobacteria bacterium]